MRRWLAALLVIAGVWPAQAFYRESWTAGPVSTSFQTCPIGSNPADGCAAAVANGNLYYAPWTFPTVKASAPVAIGGSVTLPITGPCPSTAQYENAEVIDVTNLGAFVGNLGGSSGGCVSNTSLTILVAPVSPVATNDVLKIVNATVPVAQPTAAQFSAYVRTSGQTWSSTPGPTWFSNDHPQPFNVAGVDYAIGPNMLVSSMADIAGWTQGNHNCVFMPGTDNVTTGYDGTWAYNNLTAPPPAWTGYAHSSVGSTLTLDSVSSGTIAPGMSIINNPPISGSGGIYGAQGIIILKLNSGTPNTAGAVYQLNKPLNLFSTFLGATNTFYGPNPTFGGTIGSPTFICTGIDTSAFTITGWNFGPTTFQGTPVGTHDCTLFEFLPVTDTAPYATEVDVTNNAFIDGSTCNGIHFFNTTYTLVPNIKLYNNFEWGRGLDPCCLSHVNYPYNLTKMTGSYDVQYNWTFQTTDGFLSSGFSAGNETAFPACNVGGTWSWPGYPFTEKFNYVDTFSTSYSGAHVEWGGFGLGNSLSPAQCSYQDYNVSVMIPPMPNSSLAVWLGWGVTSPAAGVGLYNEQIGNTSITNMVTGKPIAETNSYYQWLTDGCPTLSPLCPTANGPNHVIITGYGTTGSPTCGSPVACTSPVPGQGTGGNIGLNVRTSPLPTGFGTWIAGCNQNFPPLCPTAEQPSLAPSVQYPAGASNTAKTAAGTVPSGTSPLIGFSGTTTCPSAANYNNAILGDTTTNSQIGIIVNCTTGTFTLLANNAATVTSGDGLTIYGAIQNGSWQNQISSRTLSSMSHGSNQFFTTTAVGNTAIGSHTVTIAAVCPGSSPAGGLNNSVLSDNGVLVGPVFSCTAKVVTLYPPYALAAVNTSDPLTFGAAAWGASVRYMNYLDTSGAQYTYDIGSTNPSDYPSPAQGFQHPPGNGTVAGGGCMVPMDYGHGTGNINVLMTTGAEAIPSSHLYGC